MLWGAVVAVGFIHIELQIMIKVIANYIYFIQGPVINYLERWATILRTTQKVPTPPCN